MFSLHFAKTSLLHTPPGYFVCGGQRIRAACTSEQHTVRECKFSFRQPPTCYLDFPNPRLPCSSSASLVDLGSRQPCSLYGTVNRSQRFTFLLLTSMPTASPRPPFTSHWFSGSSDAILSIDAILYCRLSSNKQSSGFDNSLLLQTSHPCHTLHLNVGRPLLSIHFFSHSAQSSAEIHHILINAASARCLCSSLNRVSRFLRSLCFSFCSHMVICLTSKSSAVDRMCFDPCYFRRSSLRNP